MNNSVVHMCDQRNTKKGLFFEAESDLRDSRFGDKMCHFSTKRVLLDSIEGRLGVIFQTGPNMSSKKACLGANFGENRAKFSFRGVSPGEGKSRLGYVLKTSGYACVQHKYSSGPPGTSKGFI